MADNNFTQGGTLAIGRNLNTAIMPFFGYGFEDGIVISDAASKNLTSEHLYDLSKTLDPRMTVALADLLLTARNIRSMPWN